MPKTTEQVQATEFSVERMDLKLTASVLGRIVTYLEAKEVIRKAHGGDTESVILADVRKQKDRLDALIEQSAPGPRELFLAEHQPTYDVLDGIYDCLGEDCPPVGFASGDDRQLHHDMWGFDNALIDVRNPEQI